MLEVLGFVVMVAVGLFVVVPLAVLFMDHLSGEATLRRKVNELLRELGEREQAELECLKTEKEKHKVRMKYDGWKLQVRAAAYYE